MRSSRFTSPWSTLLATTVAITIGAYLGQGISSGSTVSMFWPAAGVAAALASDAPPRRRKWVAAGAGIGTLVSALFVTDPNWLFATGASVANTLEAYVAGAILGRTLPNGRKIVRVADLWALIRASSVAPAIGALVGGTTTALLFDTSVGSALLSWFAADSLGIFLIGPGVLAFLSARKDGSEPRKWVQPIAYTLVLLAVVGLGIYLREVTDRNFAYLILIPLMIAAIYLGQRGTAMLMVVVSFAGAIVTEAGTGPFVIGSSSMPAILALQVFLVVIQGTLLLVATEASRRRDLLAEIEGVFDAALDAVLLVDENDIVRRANKSSSEILGGGVIGRRASEFLSEPIDAQVMISQRAVLTRGRRIDGSEFWAELSEGRIAEQSMRHRRAIVIRDVTQRIEAQERLEHMRDQFVSNMTHELRTPLTSIIGYTEWLLDSAEGEARSDLELIRTSASALTEMVDDILDFKKAAETEAAAEYVDFGLLVDKVVVALKPAADGRKVDILSRTESRVEVVGDHQQLERVVANLLTNAIKYSSEGDSVSVEVRALDGTAQLRVSDQGIGISAEDQARIFERFFRARSAVTAGIPGTGLGLALARDVARAHKGDLTLESSLGVGTTMTFLLPLAPTRVTTPA